VKETLTLPPPTIHPDPSSNRNDLPDWIDQFVRDVRFGGRYLAKSLLGSRRFHVVRRDSMNGNQRRRLRGNHCTMNTFDVTGVPPLIGRATIAADMQEVVHAIFRTF
jgi:hypothetical protein